MCVNHMYHVYIIMRACCLCVFAPCMSVCIVSECVSVLYNIYIIKWVCHVYVCVMCTSFKSSLYFLH